MSPEAVSTLAGPVAETTSTPPALECRSLTVGYGDTIVLRDLSLSVDAGETIAILGPSGSGKTTLLHTVAGFLQPTAGELLIDGHVVASSHTCVPPEKRKVAMVFQNYALWPHLDALDNVAYPLRRSGVAKTQARAAAMSLLERVGAAHLARRRPAELSGGQQQRVGVARALARSGGITLLDEPTAHLDPALRAQVQAEISHAVRPASGAVVYATHDAAEALAIADRVALMRAGRVVQIGTPVEIYEKPCDIWAARLSGAAFAIRGHVDAVSLHVTISADDDEDGDHWVLVRPEWTCLGGDFKGLVREIHYRGPYTDYTLETTAAGSAVVREDGPPSLAVGGSTTWSVNRGWPVGRP